MEESLRKWCANKDCSDKWTQQESEEFLCLAVELLLLFTQYNFTGPFDDLKDFEGVIKDVKPPVGDPFVELKENGEEINPNVVLGEFLLIARDIVKKLLASQDNEVVGSQNNNMYNL